jgi:hypothetical protein
MDPNFRWYDSLKIGQRPDPMPEMKSDKIQMPGWFKVIHPHLKGDAESESPRIFY